mmetsp:Transcript_13888/g.28157  ORF Transcript_13888/g.28157 Transcript_13888/m.28157 type:complete len:319 (+) Transcript_13888:41-997(+)
MPSASVGSATTLSPAARVTGSGPHSKRPSPPPAAVEAWSAPVRRAPSRLRSPGNWKVRPRTPQLRGGSPVSTAQRMWADLQHHAGTCCMHLLPSRWRRGPSRSDVMELQPNELGQESPTETVTRADVPAALARGASVIAAPNFCQYTGRPMGAEREAAAATVGVDTGTYNLLMDMQHRDITPDDYEMLRSLDTSVKPKTLSPRVLEIRAPCWEIPRESVPPSGMPGACVPLGDLALASGLPPVPGATRAEAAASAEPARLAATEQRCCSICMESFVAGERVRRLPCRHIFHAECIDQWLTHRSNVCPDDGLPVFGESG